jgi:hypothetical protein
MVRPENLAIDDATRLARSNFAVLGFVHHAHTAPAELLDDRVA